VRGAGLPSRRGGKLSLVLFSQELLALLTAGLGIVEGLEALLEKEASPATRAVLERLLAGLREGKRFSGVLSEQPALFPPLYVGIVRAAEGTSDLPRALERYIEYQQRIDVVRAKIVSASIYPAILLVVGGGVSIFLMSYVVPRFAEVYQGAGRNLPWMSRMMLEWGQFAGRHAGGLLLSFGWPRSCWRGGASAACCARAAPRACWRSCPASASAPASTSCRACT
jgi:general secretion pathway protein F